MGLLSFIKNAGEKLFGSHKEVEEQAQTNVADLNAKAATAIAAYINQQNLGLSDLNVSFDGSSGVVTLSGTAPSQEASEKAALAAGNVQGVENVTNNLTVSAPADESQYHDVVSGDTLWKIAEHYYGDGSKYPQIFEANKPMLSDPNKIYPGQKLRIPPL